MKNLLEGRGHGQNRPLDHAFPLIQGEAQFVDDRPLLPHEIFVGIVPAPVARGVLKGVDFKGAESIKGYVGGLTAQDLMTNGPYGPIFADQPLLVEQEIQYRDQTVALVACDNERALRQAIAAVNVEVEEHDPILSIEDAIKYESVIGPESVIERGDLKSLTKYKSFKGTMHSGGQDHFYLESQAVIAYPVEGGRFEIHASTQHPSELQHWAAHFLGVGYHDVVCVVRRMGGGFGGKESQSNSFGVMAALVAQKFQRPARLILTKDEDMCQTGKRHPFYTEYEVFYTDDGVIKGLDAMLYADGGAYADLSTAILDRALFHADGCYYLEHARLRGQVMKTNLVPNTAFRGFGGPQGTAVIESIMEDLGAKLGMDPFEVRRRNLYSEGRDTTPYGQPIGDNHMPRIYEALHASSAYEQRRQDIESFNQKSTTKLRGLAITGTKFGISFTNRMLNQGNANVLVHLDGTVQVSTGATEMGQGVKTKIQQLVAEVFTISPVKVRVLETRTDVNPNTSPTAASSGTDINGAAAVKAALEVRARLDSVLSQYWAGIDEGQEIEPASEVKAKVTWADGTISSGANKVTFKEACSLAYQHRVSLAEHAHYKTAGIHYDKAKGRGKPFQYFTQGAAMAEVEIDRLTGELEILSSHILMDLGRMVNPGVDRGQTSGAYIQGVGWATGEALVWNNQGLLLSHSPTTYKIPNIQDIPQEFVVNFIENPHNAGTIRGSKAVGEPPFLLGVVAFAAVKNALSYSQEAAPSQLQIPATGEEILRCVKA